MADRSERPDTRVTFEVTVGVYRESLTADEARLLLHEACDALSKAGGPLVRIWADTDPLSREEAAGLESRG